MMRFAALYPSYDDAGDLVGWVERGGTHRVATDHDDEGRGLHERAVSPTPTAAAATGAGARRIRDPGHRSHGRDLAAHPRRATGLRRPRDARTGASEPDG